MHYPNAPTIMDSAIIGNPSLDSILACNNKQDAEYEMLEKRGGEGGPFLTGTVLTAIILSILGNRLVVGQRTLNPSTKVRILLPQPLFLKNQAR